MTSAIISGGNRYKVLINSIGQAMPKTVIAIAKGLNVPAQRVASIIYQAPAILVDNITLDVAQQMNDLLSNLGYDVSVCEQDTPIEIDHARYDVSVYIQDPAAYNQTLSKLCDFIGGTPEDAAKLIDTPPGIVLGDVSQATVEALRRHLPDGADVLSSRPDQALYDLFLQDADHHVERAILNDLKHAGLDIIAQSGCISRSIDQSKAKSLWARHAKTGALRMVNQDFLRCDIVLSCVPSNGSLTAEQRAVLTNVAGIPDHHLDAVITHCPVTVMEALPYSSALHILADFTETGLGVRADLITFARYGISLQTGPVPAQAEQCLAQLGLAQKDNALRAYPYELPYVFAELEARRFAHQLERLGFGVEFFDPEEGA